MVPSGLDSAITRALLERVRNGEQRAFEELFSRHRAYLRHVVALRLDHSLRRRVDESDIVQETHLEAAQRLNQYVERPTIPFRLWLRRIACDRLVMMRRRHLEAARRALNRELPLPDASTLELAEEALARGPTASQQAVRGEVASHVRQALTELQESDREIVLMRNYERLSNLEVAQVLGIEPAAASKRYARALLRLRTLLVERGLTE